MARVLAMILIGCASSFACTSSPNAAPSTEVAASELEGDARTAAQDELRALAGAPEFQSCIEDTDCVATRFHDCCADTAGASQCEWWAVRGDQLEPRQQECGAEECTDGAAFCPDTDEVPGEPRCAVYRIGDYVEGVCAISGGG